MSDTREQEEAEALARALEGDQQREREEGASAHRCAKRSRARVATADVLADERITRKGNSY